MGYQCIIRKRCLNTKSSVDEPDFTADVKEHERVEAWLDYHLNIVIWCEKVQEPAIGHLPVLTHLKHKGDAALVNTVSVDVEEISACVSFKPRLLFYFSKSTENTLKRRMYVAHSCCQLPHAGT